MKIERISSWNEEFFAQWVKFSHTLYDSKKHLAEDLQDVKKVLGDASLFPQDRWIALSAFSDGALQARALVAVNTKNPHVAKVGYVEFVNDLGMFKKFWTEVELVARELGASELKGPIDLNFFINYRWKTFGTAKPFFREPQQKSYYIDYFREVGMLPIKTWDSFRLSYLKSMRNYGQIRKASDKKRPNLRVTVRDINLNRFEEELETFYHLLVKSFEQMSEFEPIPIETFKTFYLGFRPLINPRFVSFAEYQGHPVGFCINYFDPLHILMQRQRWMKWLPQKLVDAWAYLRLKLNFRRLLIVYIGKVPGPNGEDFKGLQGAFAKKQTPWILGTMPQLLSCYNAEDSPSRKGFHPEQIKTIASYAVFGKSLK